jgi:hypothetical protein
VRAEARDASDAPERAGFPPHPFIHAGLGDISAGLPCEREIDMLNSCRTNRITAQAHAPTTTESAPAAFSVPGR